MTFPSAANPGTPVLLPQPVGIPPAYVPRPAAPVPGHAVPAYPALPAAAAPTTFIPAKIPAAAVPASPLRLAPAAPALPLRLAPAVPAYPYGFTTTANPAALVPSRTVAPAGWLAPAQFAAPRAAATGYAAQPASPATWIDPWGMPQADPRTTEAQGGFSFASGGPLSSGGYAPGPAAWPNGPAPLAGVTGPWLGGPAMAAQQRGAVTAPAGAVPGWGGGFALDAGLPMPLPAGPPMLFDRSGWNAAAVGQVDVEAALALAYRVAASLPADAVAERRQLQALIGRLESNPDAATIDVLADYAETLAAGIGGLRPVAETLRIALDDASNGAYYDASVAQPAIPWDGHADAMGTYGHLYDATGGALPAGVPMEGLDDIASTIEDFIPAVAGTDLEGILDQIAADIESGHLDAAAAANHLRTLLPQIDLADPASAAGRIANAIAGMLVQSIDRASDGTFTDALFGDPNAALDLPDLRGIGATGDFATGQWLGEPRVAVPFSRERQPGSGTPTVSYIRRPEGSAPVPHAYPEEGPFTWEGARRSLELGAQGTGGLVADIVGGPVDLVTWAMNGGINGFNHLFGTNVPTIQTPFMGSEWIGDRATELAESLGIEVRDLSEMTTAEAAVYLVNRYGPQVLMMHPRIAAELPDVAAAIFGLLTRAPAAARAGEEAADMATLAHETQGGFPASTVTHATKRKAPLLRHPEYPPRGSADYVVDEAGYGLVQDANGTWTTELDGAGNPVRYFDDQGRLIRTRVGVPIDGQRYVVGVQSRSGRDVRVPPQDWRKIADHLNIKVSEGNVTSRDALAEMEIAGGRPAFIRYRSNLRSKDIDPVGLHETAHAIADYVHVPLDGIYGEQARRIYRDSTTYGSPPADIYEKPGQVEAELSAEVWRAILSDPNYVKTVAPELYWELARRLAGNPRLNRLLVLASADGATDANIAEMDGDGALWIDDPMMIG